MRKWKKEHEQSKEEQSDLVLREVGETERTFDGEIRERLVVVIVGVYGRENVFESPFGAV